MDTIRLQTKLIFWLLLGFLSVALAEVSVVSAPLAFVNPVEMAFLTLFYGSHLLLLAWLAFRRGLPSLSALWLGGVLFGLYEFYITKVLWAPPWGDTISLAHLDVVTFVVLALFWHPFMAFILPLAAGEALGTSSRGVRDQLPAWLTRASQRRNLLMFVIVALIHGMLTGDPGVALASTGSALVAVAVVAWWWRRGGRGRAWTLRALLPSDREGRWLSALVALWYLVFIPLWDPQLMPPLLGHVVVWLLYAGFARLFVTAPRGSVRANRIDDAAGRTRRRMIGWAGAFLIVSVIGSLGRPEIGFLVVWIVAAIAGLAMLTSELRRSLRRIPRGTPPSSRDDGRAHT